MIKTNGSLITSEKFEFFKDNNIYLEVSIDGPAEVHDKWRVTKDSRGSFKKIKENLIKLMNFNSDYYHKYVSFSCVLHPPYEYIKIDNFFSNHYLFKHNHISAGFVENDKSKQTIENESLEKLKKKAINSYALEKKGRNKLADALFLPLLKMIHYRDYGERNIIRPHSMCVPGGKKPYIDTDGKIHMCPVATNTKKLGMVNTGINYQISKKLLEKYIKVIEGLCQNCWAKKLCKNCYPLLMDGNHLKTDKIKISCNRMKIKLEKALEIYTSVREKNDRAFDNILLP